MSKLQLYAHRCPVMGKAMAVQSSKYGAAAGIRAFSAQTKTTGKARLHTSRNQEARAVESPILEGRKNGEFLFTFTIAIVNHFSSTNMFLLLQRRLLLPV